MLRMKETILLWMAWSIDALPDRAWVAIDVMRVIEQNAPGHVLNHGSVVFHAGANVANRWADFQQYSEADREFFDQLLPMEDLDFGSADDLEVEPVPAVSATKSNLMCAARAPSSLRRFP